MPTLCTKNAFTNKLLITTFPKQVTSLQWQTSNNFEGWTLCIKKKQSAMKYSLKGLSELLLLYYGITSNLHISNNKCPLNQACLFGWICSVLMYYLNILKVQTEVVQSIQATREKWQMTLSLRSWSQEKKSHTDKLNSLKKKTTNKP